MSKTMSKNYVQNYVQTRLHRKTHMNRIKKALNKTMSKTMSKRLKLCPNLFKDIFEAKHIFFKKSCKCQQTCVRYGGHRRLRAQHGRQDQKRSDGNACGESEPKKKEKMQHAKIPFPIEF